jgi:hypothetical protein
MRDVIEEARRQQTKGDKEDILRNSGLHDVEVSGQFQCPMFSTESCSKYCGSLGIQIRTRPFRMTRFIGMMAGSSVDISGFT